MTFCKTTFFWLAVKAEKRQRAKNHYFGIFGLENLIFSKIIRLMCFRERFKSKKYIFKSLYNFWLSWLYNWPFFEKNLLPIQNLLKSCWLRTAYFIDKENQRPEQNLVIHGDFLENDAIRYSSQVSVSSEIARNKYVMGKRLPTRLKLPDGNIERKIPVPDPRPASDF